MGSAAGAVVGGGLSLLGGIFGGRSAEKAAETQASAADQSAALQWKMYKQTRADLAPWREAGKRGLAGFEGVLQDYQGYIEDPSTYLQSPGYNWLREQGEQGLARGFAARGLADSGRAGKDFMRFGQGLASQDYGNFLGRYGDLLNRYAGLANIGQTTSSQLGQLGASAAGNVGSALMAGGQARAGGYINQANAMLGGIQGGVTNYLAMGGGLPTMNMPRPGNQLFANQPGYSYTGPYQYGR